MSERHQPELRREDFQNALKELDSYIDVTLEDLMHINRTAQKHAQLRQAENLMIRDIMTTDVATVRPDTPLRDAARILLELRISGLPVVDENNVPVGIVTEADFLTAMGIPCHHPAHSLWQTLESMFKHHPNQGNMPATVADIMAHQVITITDTKTLHDAIDTMKKHHIKRVVVTNEQQQVQGIITRSNLVKVLLQQIL
ncbi:MAG TPA: CBS domain-containing protein [Gammaproteobacteria bacterium]